MQPSNQSQTLAANTTGGQMEMYTTVFGNVNFLIQPSMTGEVSNTFGTVPYMSIESVMYAGATGYAQVDPGTILSGQSQGQQNIQGTTTITDGNGLPRMVMGYSQGAF
jgi:hypothetical protein